MYESKNKMQVKISPKGYQKILINNSLKSHYFASGVPFIKY